MDASRKASAFGKGATEADLFKAAGAPSRRASPPLPECAEAGGTHELIYDVSIWWIGLGEDPSSMRSFCIGNNGKIILTSMTMF
jgi:hypothetical protein